MYSPESLEMQGWAFRARKTSSGPYLLLFSERSSLCVFNDAFWEFSSSWAVLRLCCAVTSSADPSPSEPVLGARMPFSISTRRRARSFESTHSRRVGGR